MNYPSHIQLLFVDGLGLPPEPLEDSIYACAPTLMDLLANHCVPLDATLGVPGLPQSATGQTTLFTGINAAARVGRHCEGFPSAELRGIIESGNLFSFLQEAGRSCTFANAYATRPGRQLPMMIRSVTTVMTLHALGETRNLDALLAGEAVYHDITRENLPERGVNDVPRISEPNAARHLLDILHTVDVSLFEYFLTDHVGHRGTIEQRCRVLAALDRFMAAFIEHMDVAEDLLLVVSDHGNIEEVTRRGHTTHPVPWIAVGCSEREARRGMRSLLDVCERVLMLAGVSRHSAENR